MSSESTISREQTLHLARDTHHEPLVQVPLRVLECAHLCAHGVHQHGQVDDEKSPRHAENLQHIPELQGEIENTIRSYSWYCQNLHSTLFVVLSESTVRHPCVWALLALIHQQRACLHTYTSTRGAEVPQPAASETREVFGSCGRAKMRIFGWERNMRHVTLDPTLRIFLVDRLRMLVRQ